MSSSQKISVISLVFKKGEQNYLSNYRPIRLTNTDYKIRAFVFAKRLQKVDIKTFRTFWKISQIGYVNMVLLNILSSLS